MEIFTIFTLAVWPCNNITVCFVQVEERGAISVRRRQVAMVTFTNPFSVAVRGVLTVAGSGLLENKVLIKYVKSFSAQSQFAAVHSNLTPFCTNAVPAFLNVLQ